MQKWCCLILQWWSRFVSPPYFFFFFKRIISRVKIFQESHFFFPCDGSAPTCWLLPGCWKKLLPEDASIQLFIHGGVLGPSLKEARSLGWEAALTHCTRILQRWHSTGLMGLLFFFPLLLLLLLADFLSVVDVFLGSEVASCRIILCKWVWVADPLTRSCYKCWASSATEPTWFLRPPWEETLISSWSVPHRHWTTSAPLRSQSFSLSDWWLQMDSWDAHYGIKLTDHFMTRQNGVWCWKCFFDAIRSEHKASIADTDNVLFLNVVIE